jgi:hypothetical protein
MWVAVSGAAVAADWTVAVNGSDENPGTESQPFATLERARAAVRQEENQPECRPAGGSGASCGHVPMKKRRRGRRD